MSSNALFSSKVEVHSPECSYSKQLPNCVGQSGQNHRWSGWPGAFCLDCNVGDPTEACMGGCKCECHKEFWKEYAEYCAKEQLEMEKQMKELITKHTELGWRLEFYFVVPHYIVRARKLDKKGEDTLFASIFKSGISPRDAFLEANKWMTFQEEHGG